MKHLATILVTLIITINLALPTLCFAQTAITERPPIIPNTSETELLIPHTKQNTNLSGEDVLREIYLPAITRTVIALAGATAVLFIIIGGIQILTAYGNDEKLGNAKHTITYAIVGLLIALLSYAIVSIISGLGNTF